MVPASASYFLPQCKSMIFFEEENKSWILTSYFLPQSISVTFFCEEESKSWILISYFIPHSILLFGSGFCFLFHSSEEENKSLLLLISFPGLYLRYWSEGGDESPDIKKHQKMLQLQGASPLTPSPPWCCYIIHWKDESLEIAHMTSRNSENASASGGNPPNPLPFLMLLYYTL